MVFKAFFKTRRLPSWWAPWQDITLIDTPGVLSGRKQSIGREYDFASLGGSGGDGEDVVWNGES